LGILEILTGLDADQYREIFDMERADPDIDVPEIMTDLIFPTVPENCDMDNVNSASSQVRNELNDCLTYLNWLNEKVIEEYLNCGQEYLDIIDEFTPDESEGIVAMLLNQLFQLQGMNG